MLKKADKFLASKKLYAVNPETLIAKELGPKGYRFLYSVKAIWFGKSDDKLPAVFYGDLQSFATEEWDYETFAKKGSFSKGFAIASWDGKKLWKKLHETLSEKEQEMLKETLKNQPELPEGYQGWYLVN